MAKLVDMVELMLIETLRTTLECGFNPRFQLLLVKEYQRLKADEQKQIGWSAKRELSKINYRIHTDAIKANLIPSEVTREQAAMKYADEADVLNIAMFGMTARQWREQNPDKKGNIRDYASINELICLSNMENLNAVFINDGMPQSERLIKLNQIAIQQMRILEDTGGRNLLKVKTIMAQQKYTQTQQVIDTLRKTGGYATLGDLYHLVDTKSWELDSQRINPRIVQQLTKYLRYSQVFGHWRNVVKK